MTHATSTKSTPRETPYSRSEGAAFFLRDASLRARLEVGGGEADVCLRLRDLDEGDDAPGIDSTASPSVSSSASASAPLSLSLALGSCADSAASGTASSTGLTDIEMSQSVGD